MNLWNEWRRHCRREDDGRTVTRKTLIGTEDEFTREKLTATTAEWIEEVIEESEMIEEEQ
jgi:hypothetical protein